MMLLMSFIPEREILEEDKRCIYLGKRIVYGLLAGICVIFILTCLPKYCLNILTTIVAIGSTYELIGAIQKLGYKPMKSIAYASCLVFLFIGVVNRPEFNKWSLAFLGAVIMISLIYAFFIRREKNSLIDICFTFFSVLYIVVLLLFFVLTYYVSNEAMVGRFLVWYIIFAACFTDIFAYFIGSKFGKHKLCPEISPKKSIEGAVAGVIGCIITLLIYTFVLNNYFNFDINYIGVAVISVIASVFGQLGDLVASSIKRSTGIKDFGNFLPGHGGMLDRIDSLLFVAPVIYYFLVYFVK